MDESSQEVRMMKVDYRMGWCHVLIFMVLVIDEVKGKLAHNKRYLGNNVDISGWVYDTLGN